MSSPQAPTQPTQYSTTLGKAYEPETFEKEIYQYWESNGCFKAADENATLPNGKKQKSFAIMIPPPNVTGVLHMGHALTNTIQDILIRWRRMHGDNTLWLPGTDHAGIATQAQVEKHIAKEKGPSGRPLTRHDLGREVFLEHVWKWKEEHEHLIKGQLKRMGSSLDWSRERFTMDEGLSQSVREIFVRLYKDGLIYRGERIINWCCRCQTALSDLEVIPTDRKGSFWHLAYAVVNEDGTPVLNADGKPEMLTIATTRPETLLGDSAVAVHPEDERYTHLHGKKVKLPLLGRLLPILLDTYVDREFGSGALKITPAHDFNDYDIGQRHQLPIVQVMGKDGKISAAGGPYAGLKFTEARERVIQDLKEGSLLIKTEDHAHKVGLCQRCDSVAEPMVSKQWFVKIAPLAKPAIDAVESGKIEFVPKTWEKTYFEWMYNIRDWCISRQLWWGHQIPAWYCGACQGVTVERETPTHCPHCDAEGSQLKQDEDVLDTWFSSGLWPFSTLGWPNQTAALKTFYPTAILETGFDIIFFWVARMIMMGIYAMKEVPFKKVYLHAMVRDEKGQKMSKSRGNVIDPLVIADQYGTDALRFTLAIMAGQGRDVKLSLDRVEGYRGFCNKLYNAVKFFHLQVEQVSATGVKFVEPTEGLEAYLKANHKKLSVENRWILSRLQSLTATVDKTLDQFELNVGSQAIYDFVWGEFCDWFIELSKQPVRAGGEGAVHSLMVLHYVMEQVLKVAHPFIPFVTEELWQSLPFKKAANTPAREKEGQSALMTLMFQRYPKAIEAFVDRDAEFAVREIQSVIEALRSFRGENSVSPKTEFALSYVALNDHGRQTITQYGDRIQSLSRITGFKELPGGAAVKAQDHESVIPLAGIGLELRIDLRGLVNVEEETKRLKKEIENVNSDLAHIRGKLTKESFIAKAPKELIEKERAKEAELMIKLKEIETAVSRLAKLAK